MRRHFSTWNERFDTPSAPVSGRGSFTNSVATRPGLVAPRDETCHTPTPASVVPFLSCNILRNPNRTLGRVGHQLQVDQGSCDRVVSTIRKIRKVAVFVPGICCRHSSHIAICLSAGCLHTMHTLPGGAHYVAPSPLLAFGIGNRGSGTLLVSLAGAINTYDGVSSLSMSHCRIPVDLLRQLGHLVVGDDNELAGQDIRTVGEYVGNRTGAAVQPSAVPNRRLSRSSRANSGCPARSTARTRGG